MMTNGEKPSVLNAVGNSTMCTLRRTVHISRTADSISGKHKMKLIKYWSMKDVMRDNNRYRLVYYTNDFVNFHMYIFV